MNYAREIKEPELHVARPISQPPCVSSSQLTLTTITSRGVRVGSYLRNAEALGFSRNRVRGKIEFLEVKVEVYTLARGTADMCFFFHEGGDGKRGSTIFSSTVSAT